MLGGVITGEGAGAAFLHPNEVARGRVGQNHDLEAEGVVVGWGQGADDGRSPIPCAEPRVIDPEERREVEYPAAEVCAEQPANPEARPAVGHAVANGGHQAGIRSEERRVGKEGRSRWSTY